MFNYKLKYIFSFSFLLLSIQSVLPNLLPGNVVQVGRNTYSFVGNLKQNQLIRTLDERFPRDLCRTHLDFMNKKEEFSDRAILIELKPRDGEAGLLMIGEDQYFHRQGVLEKLKPRLLKCVKRGNKKLLKILLKTLWVKAKDLKIGDKLKGRHGETLFVRKVENVEFDKKMDFYELSLKHHHTFYVIDTAGNHVLTHNIEPFTIFAICMGACILGGGIYGYFRVKKNSDTDGGATRKEIAKGILIYGGIGAAVGAAIGLCITVPAIGSGAKTAFEFVKGHKTASTIFAALGSVSIYESYVFLKKDPNAYNSADFSKPGL